MRPPRLIAHVSGLHAAGLHAAGLHAAGLHAAGLHPAGLRALLTAVLAATVVSGCGLAAPPVALRPSGAAKVAGTSGPPPTPSATSLMDEDDGGGAPRAATPTAPAAPGQNWHPSAPLPALGAPGQRLDIVLSPHPDDETLSLGVWVGNRAAHGDRVIVVALTDGRATGANLAIGRRLGRTVDRNEIAAARTLEMRAADADLGVAAGDVYPAHLDADASLGGSRATVAEIADVITVFAERYPGAYFATMSYLAEHHPDHLNAGTALVQAWRSHQVAHADFAVSRLYWPQPMPGEYLITTDSPEVRARVIAAARAYELWDPAGGRLGVGWASVHPQFAAMITDPVDKLHNPTPGG